jgi:hypothetical protein
MGLFDTLFGGGAEKEAAERNRAQLNNYQTSGLNYLSSGYDTATGNLNSALGAFQPLSSLAGQYGQGTTMLLNSLGLNGAAGGQTAWDAFQNANPQTQGAIDAGIEAINRRRAAGGMLNSGNADADALKFAQNLQNQQYGNWQNSLAGLNNNALAATGAAATGQSGVYGGLANLAQQNASNKVNLLGNVTSGMMSANNQQAAGEAAGAKNLLGLGTSLLGLGTGGGGTIGGSLLSGIGKLF